MKSRVTENSANMERWATENLANTKSRVMENLVNMENRIIQDSGARNRKKEKVLLQAKGQSMVVPTGYYQDTKTQIAKDVSKRVGQEKRRGRAGLLV
jgi:hypothetical protein